MFKCQKPVIFYFAIWLGVSTIGELPCLVCIISIILDSPKKYVGVIKADMALDEKICI